MAQCNPEPTRNYTRTREGSRCGRAKTLGISSAAAELLLKRMLVKIDDLCAERDLLKRRRAALRRGACLAALREQLK